MDQQKRQAELIGDGGRAGSSGCIGLVSAATENEPSVQLRDAGDTSTQDHHGQSWSAVTTLGRRRDAEGRVRRLANRERIRTHVEALCEPRARAGEPASIEEWAIESDMGVSSA